MRHQRPSERQLDKENTMKENNDHWKNEAYWRLPENVRNAVDLANMK